MFTYKKLSAVLALPLFILLFAFAACKKDSNDSQEPTLPPALKPGAIKGDIVPANAAVKIVCTPASGQPVELLAPNSNFKIDNLAAGTYNISVVPKLGYTAPASVTVTVPAGDTVNVGTLNLTANGQTKGYLRFTMNTVAYDIAAPDVSCTYTSNVLGITAITPATTPEWKFNFNINNVTAAGTYNLTAFTTSSYIEALRYLPTTTLVYSTTVVSTNPPQPSGSAAITITELNTNTHVITGTFTATLPQKGLGSGQVQRITNGSFMLNY